MIFILYFNIIKDRNFLFTSILILHHRQRFTSSTVKLVTNFIACFNTKVHVFSILSSICTYLSAWKLFVFVLYVRSFVDSLTLLAFSQGTIKVTGKILEVVSNFLNFSLFCIYTYL